MPFPYQVNDDPLLFKLDQIFAERILSGFSNDRLVELGKEGQPRYSAKIPPGYMDERKNEDGDLRKFGDFFVWKELLEHGKERKLPLIFVTGDEKEDWWQEVKGGGTRRTLGPRPELIAEFREHSGQMFYMYLPDRFLEWASKQRGQDVKPAALSEVREVQDQVKAAVSTSASVKVRLIESENLLVERATADPRNTIKRSWELLGVAVLHAAKVPGENVQPDSEEISISLKRLESDTKYPLELIILIRNLRQIATNVFHHSQFVFDPSPKAAEEFVRYSVAARKDLGENVQ